MNLHKDHSPINGLLGQMSSDIAASTADPDLQRKRKTRLRRGSGGTMGPRSGSGTPVRGPQDAHSGSVPLYTGPVSVWQRCVRVVRKYLKFVGPGIMVSVAYLDPGNYSSSVSAGFTHKYKLLFSILVSTLMACFLQILCIKLGTVTGLDLAQNCREHFPTKLNVTLYVLAEIAIIATDLAEVVGTAISLKILFNIPLIFGVILTVVDVLIVLMAYRPNGPMFIIRIFEAFITLLVAGTVVCFGIELYQIAPNTSASEVFRGFLPSDDVFQGDGLYLSLAILGATVMPHSLFLGSGLVQTRLRDFDEKNGNYTAPAKTVESAGATGTGDAGTGAGTGADDAEDLYLHYRPSIDAIRDAMHYSIAELIASLFTVALFVNSAILIVAGSTLGKSTEDDLSTSEADLFTIYDLLTKYLSKSAGVLYAAALLLSGQSAGVVCTLAGQMVSEGFLRWTLPPALRRLLTRAVAITPCLILVLVSGRKGLSAALNASQVVLALLLPIVSAPLIYFTCSKTIMRVPLNRKCNVNMGTAAGDLDVELDDLAEHLIGGDEHYDASDSDADASHDGDDYDDPASELSGQYVDMSNGKFTATLAVLVWALITFLNGYLLISLALGREIPM